MIRSRYASYQHKTILYQTKTHFFGCAFLGGDLFLAGDLDLFRCGDLDLLGDLDRL